MTTILIVEDEESLADPLAFLLRKEGFEPIVAHDGKTALEEFERHDVDIVLLDLMLPGMSGTDVCKQLRATSSVPVIMVTARDSEIDKVVGLELGADDYVTKPFKPKELVARVRARLRRTETKSSELIEVGDLLVDVSEHTVTRHSPQGGPGEELSLTPLEFDLLVEMARKPGQVHTREELLEKVWGYRHASDTRLVNVHVQRLRAKIEHDPEDPQIVLTVRGVGYKTGKND